MEGMWGWGLAELRFRVRAVEGSELRIRRVRGPGGCKTEEVVQGRGGCCLGQLLGSYEYGIWDFWLEVYSLGSDGLYGLESGSWMDRVSSSFSFEDHTADRSIRYCDLWLPGVWA